MPADAAPPNDLWRYRLALVAAAVLWSVGGLFIKTLTAEPAWHSSALGITFYRSLFAALWLLPLARGRKPPKPADVAVAVVLYSLLLALYVSATQGTTAANAIFLQYTAPLYALALGPWLCGDPFRREDAWALLGAMAGVAILFFGNFHGGERGPLVMGLGSGLMFGLFLLWVRRLRYAHPVAVTTVNNLGVAVVAAIALAAVNPPELALVPRALVGEQALWKPALLLVLMGGIQIAAPYVLFSYGLTKISGVEGSLLALAEPLLNPVWVLLFVGERPTGWTVAGGLVILASLAGRYLLVRPIAAAARAG